MSLILYGVDAASSTPLYVAEMLMFFILGAERSDYSKSKPLLALYAVLFWIACQVMLLLNRDVNLLWAVVALEVPSAYLYFSTDKLKVSVREKKRGYTDYSCGAAPHLYIELSKHEAIQQAHYPKTGQT